MTTGTLTLRLLGDFVIMRDGRTVVSDGNARRKPLALLKLLALAPERRVSRDRALAALWPELPQTSAATQLRKSRLFLKRTTESAGIGVDLIALAGGHLSLIAGVTIDVEDFQRAAEVALDHGTDALKLTEAIALYGGDLLPDDHDEWITQTRADLRVLFGRLLETAARLQQARGDLDAAAGLLRRLVAVHPASEDAHRQLMRVYAASGHRELALRQFAACHAAVRTAFDADVEPATRQLHEELSRGTKPKAGPVARPRIVVGRETELHSMREALDRAISGDGGAAVVLAGEPGVGKTTLAEEFASYAMLRGCAVAWGRSYDEDGAQGYAPWMEVLAGILPVGDEADPGLKHILAPGLRGRAHEEPAAESQRSLFVAVSAYVRAAADARPLLIVLDDIHWADDDSVALARTMVRDIRGARVVLVVTVRQHEGSPSCNALLHDMHREPHTLRIDIEGLGEAGVRQLLERSGASLSDGLAEALWERTRGNPLFVTEYVRLYRGDAEGLLAATPQGVAEVMRRRLSRLPPACRELLSAAAVLGQEFELAMLARITETTEISALSALEPAVDGGILDRPAPPALSLRFSHPLLHRTVYDGTPVEQRVLMHHRAATALLGRHAAGDEEALALIAHHFTQCATIPGAAAHALKFSELAADRSMRRLAFEDAARLYRGALSLLAVANPADLETRGRLRLRLGRSLWRLTRIKEAVRSYEDAVDDGRAVGSADVVGQAALSLSRLAQSRWVVYERTIALIDEAIALAGPSDSALRAELLAALAEKLAPTRASDRSIALADEATAIARRLNEPAVLCRVLLTWHDVAVGIEDLEERLQVAAEIKDLARAAGDYPILGMGYVHRLAALLQRGDVAIFDRELAELTSLSVEFHMRSNMRHALSAQSTRAAMRGDFTEAEALASEALQNGQSAGDPDAISAFGGQLFLIRWLQGRATELEPLVPQFTREVPGFTPWKAAVALMYADGGREEQARALFGEIAAAEFESLPRDRFWLVTVGVLSQVCAHLGDRQQAAVLYELALPFAAHFGVTSFSQGCIGSMHRPLALLAAAVDDLDRAIAHAEHGLASNRAIGAAPWVALGQTELARLLLVRRRRGDRRRAMELASGAADTARQLGMTRIAVTSEELTAVGA